MRVIFLSMANLLVKGIPTELLAAVNYAAKMSGNRQGEFVIKVLQEAVKNVVSVRVPVVKKSRASKPAREEGPAMPDPDPFADAEFVSGGVRGRVQGGGEPERAAAGKAPKCERGCGPMTDFGNKWVCEKNRSHPAVMK